jgi:hypothetical protein
VTDVFNWLGEAPGGVSVAVALTADGTWQVIYGGFSRATSRQLEVALAEASGDPRSAEWILELERQLASVSTAR